MRRLIAVCLLLAACGSGRPQAQLQAVPPAPSSVPTSAPATTAPPTTPTTVTTPPTVTGPPTPVDGRVVHEQDWIPFGVAEDVTLHYPSSRVERIGFHQSNDEGARPIEPLSTGIPATTLGSRDRLSDPNSAADVVVDPTSEIRSPVSGRVTRTGSYNLYCDLYDYYIDIDPDDHPGWEVRILHITDVDVRSGERVEAGETVVAPAARQLPFASEVDDLRSADPAWPHVHIEVVDPSIPNVPNGGSGYENC